MLNELCSSMAKHKKVSKPFGLIPISTLNIFPVARLQLVAFKNTKRDLALAFARVFDVLGCLSKLNRVDTLSKA